jgi:hypothetical protein
MYETDDLFDPNGPSQKPRKLGTPAKEYRRLGAVAIMRWLTAKASLIEAESRLPIQLGSIYLQ